MPKLLRPSGVRDAYGNLPSEVPELTGVCGCAWSITPARVGAPGSHWLFKDALTGWYYLVDCVPLESPEVDGGSHSMVFVALDPREPLPDLDGWRGGAALCVEFLHRFTVRSDAQAQQLTRMVIQDICDQGRLRDYAYRCRTVDDTAEHFMYGTHPSMN